MATVREQLEAKYGTPTTKSPVVSRETPAVSIRAQLEAKYKKPKTYAEKSAEMQSQGQAVATKGRFNRTGEITPSLGGNIVRGIARIPVEAALSVARGFGGLGSKKIREEGLTIKSKFLGDIKDYATSVEDTAKELSDRVNRGEISKGRAVVGVLGASAEKALDLASVVPAGAVLSAEKTAIAQGAKGVARESLKSATKTALKRSGTLAGGYDIAQQAKEGNGYNPLRTAGAVALGTVADVGLSNVLPRIVSPRRKTVDDYIREIFKGTTGDVAKIENSAFRAKKGLELLIKESKDIEIPDSKAPLGSGATKSFDIKNSKPNELLSGVLEMDKKITAKAREATEKARQAGLKINISNAEAKIQRAIDTGEVPKTAGERMLRQIRETNGDPVKIHDWIQDVNIKYKKKYERGTIEDTLTGKTADDIAEILRGDLDTIVDRKGYAEAFGNNQELKRMLVTIAKKANKQVNFGDISTEAGLDAAISILTGNPAYMARTVGTTLFKGLISRFRNKSGIKALRRSIKKQSKLPTNQKLPSSEVKPQAPILQLPAGEKNAPRSVIRASKTINLPARSQTTIDKQEINRIQSKILSDKVTKSKSKPLSLLKEVRKYKSAEDFVKAQNKTVTGAKVPDTLKIYSLEDKDLGQIYRQSGIKSSAYPADFTAKNDIPELKIKKGDRVSILANDKDAKRFTIENIPERKTESGTYSKSAQIGDLVEGYSRQDQIDFINKNFSKESLTKSQLTDIWNKANAGNKVDPLIVEAKKYKIGDEISIIDEAKNYKTPEAFIDAKNKQYVYHTTTDAGVEGIIENGLTKDLAEIYPHGQKLEDSIKKMVYFADTPEATQNAGTFKTGNIIRIKKTALDISKMIDRKMHGRVETRYWGKDISPVDIEIKTNDGWQNILDYAEDYYPDIIETMKKNNLSWNKGGAPVVTKSQLEDIWNKANKKFPKKR